MSENKLCPVCGSKPNVNDELSTRLLASCSNISCWLYSFGFHLEDWNATRPIEDQLRAENERLREALKYIVDRGYTGASYVAQQALNEVTK